MPVISTELAHRDEDLDLDPDLETSNVDVDQIDPSLAEEEAAAMPLDQPLRPKRGRLARLLGAITDDGGPSARMTALIIIGSIAVVLLAAFAARAPGIVGASGQVLLVGLVLVPLFLLIALALGILPTAQPIIQTEDTPQAIARRLAFDLLDRSDVPCLLTGKDGNPLYINEAYRSYFAVGAREIKSLEKLLATDEDAQAAIYRLCRVASRGERSTEDILVAGQALHALKDKTQGSRWLQVDVRPVESEASHYLWEVFDVTESRADGALEDVPDDERFVALNALPVGVFSVDGEGKLTFVNRTLLDWLELDQATDVSLSLFVTNEEEAARIIAGEGLTEEEIEEGWILPFEISGDRILDLRLLPADEDLLPAEAALGKSYLVTLPRDLPPAEATLLAPQVVREAGTLPRLSDFFEDAPIGVVTVNRQGGILSSNSAFRSMAGVPALPGDPLSSSLSEGDRPAVAHVLEHTLSEEGEGHAVDVSLASGQSGQMFVNAIEDPSLFGGADATAILYVIDTTEQRELELQFTQSQKMQAVGQLAGGVAHDFNNVLTAIIGYCDLLLAQHKVGDPSFADLNQIKQNANRAANLVRQLLAFSRRQTLVPKVLQLSNAIAETEMLLKRLLGEKIEVVQNQQRDLGLVKVDHGQLEQVVVNLAVNARDAMKDGGTLTLTTYNVSPDEAVALGHSIMPPQDYVCLEVSDTGHGIAKENLGNIFEPFYTTKGVGEGTGLGLSTVYGIIKQTGGFIFPESEEGAGTTFRIYLPRVPDEELPQEEDGAKAEMKDLSGEGTVLLVEDEDAVRAFAARALTTRGYRVLEASNGEMGLEIVEEEGGKIDIMVSDVVMPNMDGPTMAKHVKAKYPDIKVIFVSGYTEDAFEDDLDRPEDFTFLPKPFSLKDLASKVKEVLAR